MSTAAFVRHTNRPAHINNLPLLSRPPPSLCLRLSLVRSSATLFSRGAQLEVLGRPRASSCEKWRVASLYLVLPNANTEGRRQTSFNALNIIPDSDSDSEVDNTLELQVPNYNSQHPRRPQTNIEQTDRRGAENLPTGAQSSQRAQLEGSRKRIR